MLTDDEVEVGVIGHAVAFVRRPLDLNHAPVRVPAATHVARHVREQQEMIDRMPDRPLGEHAVRRHLDGRRVQLDQLLELRPQRHMAHRFRFLPMTTTHPDRSRRAGAIRGRRAATISLDGCRERRHARPSRAAGKASARRALVHALRQALNEIAVEQDHHGDDGQGGEMRERAERPPGNVLSCHRRREGRPRSSWCRPW